MLRRVPQAQNWTISSRTRSNTSEPAGLEVGKGQTHHVVCVDRIRHWCRRARRRADRAVSSLGWAAFGVPRRCGSRGAERDGDRRCPAFCERPAAGQLPRLRRRPSAGRHVLSEIGIASGSGPAP